MSSLNNNLGRFYEDYVVGDIITHATPRTLTEADASLYTAIYPTRFALQSSKEFAKKCGLKDRPLDDLIVFHTIFGKTVPDISINAVANLGYAEGKFSNTVFSGETLSVESEIIGLKDTTKTVCTGVEMFRKLLDSGEAGDNIGALLRGTKKEEVERGQVLAAPGSIKPHKKFKAEIYALSKEEGGRHTPFFANYRPQFYFRTTDVTGSIKLPEGTEMVMPGDNITLEVELLAPIAMDNNLRFAIREGGRTVGSGVVSEIIE